MVDLMVEDALLKDILMHSSFGSPFDCSHDILIGPFDPLVDVGCMVYNRYVDGANVNCCFFRSVICYIFRNFMSF